MQADRLLRERSARPRFLVAPNGPVERLLQLTLLDHTLDVRGSSRRGRERSAAGPDRLADPRGLVAGDADAAVRGACLVRRFELRHQALGVLDQALGPL